MTDAEKKEALVKGLYNGWIRNSLDLIYESYGLSFEQSNSAKKELRVRFEYNDPNDFAVARAGTSITIYLNKLSSVPLSETTFDQTIAHEFTHAVMYATIEDAVLLPTYFMEGSAELVCDSDSWVIGMRDLLKAGKARLETVFANTFNDSRSN